MSDKYEVGYRRPPKATRFKKGTSGNPNGRPKGTRNLRTDLSEELIEQIVIREGDRPIKVSKQRAMVKSLMAKAIKGDPRAITTIVSIADQSLGEDSSGDQADAAILRPEEHEVLAALQKRLVESGAHGARSDSNGEGSADE